MDTTITYDKPFKTYNELIELLRERNVIITNDEATKELLSDLTYYDLINGYKNLYPYDENDKFTIPIPFYEFYSLHTFDTLINNIIFKYILLIEKSLKSKISYTVSENYGVETKLNNYNTPTDYLNRKNYRNNAQRDNILFQIKESTIKSKDESIRHYKNNHNHLPCWILINGISFGLTIKWYNILKPVNKDYVCENIVHNEDLTLDQKKEFLNKGLTILRRYRNNIAHGHKIFTGNIKEELPKNQVLIVSNGLISNKDYLNGIGKNDLFAVIIIMATLLNKRYKDMFLFEIINILEGNKEEYGILPKPSGVFMFDYKQIYKYNIDTLKIPKDSTILNKPKYKLLLPKSIKITIFIVFILLISIGIYVVYKFIAERKKSTRNKQLYEKAKEREKAKSMANSCLFSSCSKHIYSRCIRNRNVLYAKEYEQ